MHGYSVQEQWGPQLLFSESYETSFNFTSNSTHPCKQLALAGSGKQELQQLFIPVS